MLADEAEAKGRVATTDGDDGMPTFLLVLRSK